MGELVYRKELWTIKDRGRWWDSYCDAVEAEYNEALSGKAAMGAEASYAGGYSGLCEASGRLHPGMYTGTSGGIGYITGSVNIGSRQIGSYRYKSLISGIGSMRTGSLQYAGSGSSRSMSGSCGEYGIMSLGYGMQLI